MKQILSIIFLTITFTVFSQVTVSIEALEADGVSIPSGSPIDLGNSSTSNVTLRVDLSKDPDFSIGEGILFVEVFNSFNVRIEKYRNNDVPEFSESISSPPIDFDINETDIDFGDENYLLVVFKLKDSPGTEWTSQQIPIIKTPSFELEPSTVNISCGDTSPQTFTVSNNSNLGGISYQWNVGDGWSGNVGASSSITIFPSNGNTLPSNVSVIPIFNGEPVITLNSFVNRAAYTPSYSIFGSATLCSSSTYSINNPSSGETITGWSVSDPSIASISSSGNQASLTANGSGNVTLTATIQNACG